MNITKESTGELTATLKLEIVESDYQKKYQDELKKFARQASIPGFRPGKVPVGMIEKRYGISILMEQINKMVNDELNNFIQSEKLSVLGDPIPNAEKGIVNFETQKDFDFYFDIGLAPEFDVALSDSLEMEYYRIKATDDQINRIIEQERKRHGNMIEVDEVGNEVEIEFDLRELDGDGKLVDESSFSPAKVMFDDIPDEEIRNNLSGKKANDIVTVNVIKLFGSLEKAAEKMGVDKGSLENKPNDHQLKIQFVQKQEPAEINQEFYDRLFPGQGIADEEACRTEIGRQIELYNEIDSDHMLISDTMEKLISVANIQLPDEFMKRWLYLANEKKFTSEEIAKDYDAMRHQLIIDMINSKLKAHYNELDITSEAIMQDFKKQIAGYLMQNIGLSDEEVEQLAEKYATEWIKDEKHKEEVNKRHRQIFETRFVKLVKSIVSITEKSVTPDEFYQMFNQKYEKNFGKMMSEHDHDHDHDHNHDHNQKDEQ